MKTIIGEVLVVLLICTFCISCEDIDMTEEETANLLRLEEEAIQKREAEMKKRTSNVGTSTTLSKPGTPFVIHINEEE